jgi:DNA polymerase III subunit delta'
MSFKDIKGQDKPIGILKSYMRHPDFTGGFLFTGPEGVGKRLVAKTFAKASNCLQAVSDEAGAETDSCDSCASCLKIEKNEHPDVHIIETEGQDIKIESIRQLKREISLKPYEGRRKVFIIDNAHNLNSESSNALLKILEEPPRMSVIILITDKPAKLFKTIISRCRTIKFSAFERGKLQKILNKDYSIGEAVSHFLAYFSEGRLGSAVRLSSQDILKEKNRVIDSFVFSRRPGLDFNAQDKKELSGQLNILASWFRDIYIIKIGVAHSEIINLDRKEELLRIMPKFSFSELNEILEGISISLLRLDQNINTKLVLYNLGALIWRS